MKSMDVLLRSVHRVLAGGDFKEADFRMVFICSQFHDKMLQSEFFDANLPHFFSMDSGVIPYVNKLLQEANIGKLSSMNKCFQTIHLIITQYADKADDYLTFIIQLCINALANQRSKRRRPMETLQAVCELETRVLHEPQLFYIYAKVKDWLHGEADSSMLARFLCLLGTLTQHQCIRLKLAEIYEIFVSLLSKIANYPDIQVILVGAYEALDAIFTNDSPSVLDVAAIYPFLERDALFDDSLSRHGNRQCVIFLSHHFPRFSTSLLASEKRWFNILAPWLHSGDEKDVAAGVEAFESLTKTFVSAWQRSPSQFSLFGAIIDNFRRLQETAANPKIQTLAVRCLGHTASISTACLPCQKFDDLFTTLAQRVEYFLITNQSNSDFVDYVEAVQSFFKECMKRKINDLALIQRVIIAVVKLFPNLSQQHHSRVIEALFATFQSVYSMSVNLRKEVKIITNFMSNIIKEATLVTCSPHQFTYVDYLPLWLGLFPKLENNFMQNLFFDEHMKVLMRVCLKYNLTKEIVHFRNFTQFYCEILSAAPEKQFKRWIHVISKQIIRRSMQLPYVIEFYRLITTCLRKISQIRLFSKKSEQKEYVKVCYRNINDFIRNVLKQFKYYEADCQQECLRLVLATPTTILREQTFDFTSIFEMVFVHHARNFQLAEIAIDALKTWMKDETIVTNVFLQTVVPYFDRFLRSTKSRADLTHLQHKILLFLAKLPDDIVLEIASKSSELQLRSVWTECLQLQLSNENRNESLKLDEIYYRALDLALHCTDRQRQLLACEVLHSQFTLFLGTSHFNTTPDVDAVFAKILPNILRLAADIDAAISNLFKPLMLQLAHWYSLPKNVNSSFSPIFVHCLLEGASHGHNAAIRDESGKVLQEFLSWTIKQNTNTSLINNLHNIKLIIENITLFSLHPDEGKRYGATVIFLSIHKDFCREETLVNMFLLEVMYAFIQNLSLSDHKTTSQLITNVNECLSTVNACLIENQTLFRQAEGEHRRITPPLFKSNNIDGIAQFLIQHSQSKSLHCRRKVIEMLNSIPNISDEFFIEMPFTNEVNSNFMEIQTTEEVLQYYGSLTCWIDWQIFNAKYKTAFDEKLFHCINFVLKDLIGKDLKEIQAMLNISPNGEQMMLLRNLFESEQVILTQKLLHLFKVLLDSNNACFINEHFLDLLVKYLFERDSLGLTQHSDEKWANKVTSYLNAMQEQKSTFQQFVLACNSYIEKKIATLKNLHECQEVPVIHSQFIRALIQLQTTNFSKNIPIPTVLSKPLQKLFDKVLEHGDGVAVPKLSASVREYYMLVLELVLDMDNPEFDEEFEALVKCLQSAVHITHPQLHNDLEFGYYVFLTFKSAIFKCTLKPQVFQHLFEQLLLEDPPVALISRLFKEYVAHLQHEKCLARNEDIRKQMFNIVNRLWSKVFGNMAFNDLIDLIQDLHRTFGVCSTSRELFENVWNRSTWNQCSDMVQTPLQKIHIVINRIRLLGMIAPYTDSKEIEDALEDIKTNHLRSLSTDFNNRVTTTLFINTLIDATFNSACINFIMYAVDLFLRLDSDCVIDAKRLLARLPQHIHESLINAVYDIDISSYGVEQKIKQTQFVCDLLAHCSYDLFETFFVRQIDNILDAFSQRCIDNKILACILLNRLFGTLNMKRIEGKTCRITQQAAVLVHTGRELIKSAANILFDITRTTAEANPSSLRFRLYQCYAYNALASLICNALRGKPQFYSRLFSRKNDRGQDILWTRLLQNMQFDFELTSHASKSKRNVLCDIQTQRNHDEEPTLQYVESQPLFFSSLSEDITDFDFSNILVREEVSTFQNTLEIQISDNDIMRHECILHICGVIKHMHETNLLPSQKPPDWIENINSLLLSGSTPSNVRQFLCKIIEISQEYLKQYADILTSGIIRTIVETCECINSLAGDLIIMLLTTWSASKPSQTDGSQLLNFIMRHIWNEDKKLFQFNTSLMQKVLESYGTLTIEYDFIESLFFVNAERKSNLAGIYILNILAVNRIAPFRIPQSTIPILRKLLRFLESASIRFVLASAETLGVILQYFQIVESNMLPISLDKLSKWMRDFMKQPHSGGLSNRSQVIQILEAIAKNYPQFAEDFFEDIASLIDQEKRPTIKALILKVFLNCIRAAPHPHFIKQMNVVNWLKTDNLEVQILTLEIILHVADHMEFAQIDRIVKFFAEMPNHDQIYRSIVVDIYIRLYVQYKDHTDEMGKELLKHIRKVLICGFVDGVPEIRTKICKFWEGIVERLSVPELFQDLFDKFYINDCEHLFIPFYNFMLLKSLRVSDHPLFAHALHSCEYRDNELIFRESCVLSLDVSIRENEELMKETRNSYQNSSSSYVNIPDLSSFIPNESKLVEKPKTSSGQDGKTVIYGNYKIGDFPFIQIKPDAILSPLAELSTIDPSISLLLFKSIYDVLESKYFDDAMLPRLKESLDRILHKTQTSNSTMIQCLLHVAYKNTKTMCCDPELIARVSLESGAIANGCLLLEEYLIKEAPESGASDSKKGVAAIPSKEIKCWMKLAEMYNVLGEFDAMHGILQDKVQSPKDVMSAIRAESERRWSDARQLYAQVIKIDYDMNRKDLYYEAFLRCSEELCDWKEMEQYCNQAMNVHENTLEKMINVKDSRIATICLPYYVKSKVLQSIECNVEFSTQIQQAVQVPSSRNVLNVFANHISLMFFDKMNLKMTTTFANTFERQFLHNWASCNPLYEHVQRKALLEMKNCAEIEHLLDVYSSCTPDNCSTIIQDITDDWQTVGQYKPMLQYYETRNCARQAFLNILKMKISSEDPDHEFIEVLNHLAFDETANLIKLALKEDNLNVARVHLTKVTKTTYQDESSIAPVWNLLKSQSILCKAKDEDERKDLLLIDAFKNYFKCVEMQGYKEKPSLWIPAAMHLRALCEEFIAHSANKEIATQFDILQSYCKEPMKTAGDWAKYSYEVLRNNVIELEALGLQSPHHVELADAFLVLAKDAHSRGEEFVHSYIEFTLKSMKYGSNDARLLFPEVLQLNELHTTCKSQFVNQTSDIPSWMFICWIPQLLAYLDTDTISAIQHIVLQIAIDYPQSMIYPYKLSRDKYTFANSETTDFVQRLDAILSNSLIDQFLHELKFVCAPSSFAKVLMSRLKKALQTSEECFNATMMAIEDLFNDARKLVKSVGSFKQKLVEVFNYCKITNFDSEEILRQLNAIQIDISKEKFDDLGFYSPWLRNFQASKYRTEIEVPGQYTGRQKPLPHYHAKIYKISQDVLAFPSLRKPIRITCYGNDAKEYRFLVKCGEDLRMDQRIQQLFNIMNSIMAKDVHCNERKLKLTTFEVIPLCNDLGVIQWVENTELLGHVLIKYSGIPNIQSILKTATDKYVTWLSGAAHIPQGSDIYAKAMLRYSKLEATISFNQIANSIPWDALKQSFIKLSRNIETFFVFRHHFIKSYAVMNICNWLLGIGDRHPENILLDMDRGNVVGIDFDHAFGSATQRQTVPELVPIRLTPQILNLMQPFGVSGMLTEAMTTALRAMRADYEILFAAMNIFIMEPTLVWSAKSWTPEDNLALIKAKFKGAHPIRLMIAEIQGRDNDLPEVNKKYVECLENVFEGIAVEKEEDLSAKEQVDCIVAMATDANLLARMWQGWAPWI